MDVVCTSGSATGVAPPVEKIKLMSAGTKRCKGAALAIASGVDEDNVEALLEAGADAVLVASSVSADFHNLDREKLESLVKKVHSYGSQAESVGESAKSSDPSEEV
jgi:predicted TIM-barrel enzyme